MNKKDRNLAIASVALVASIAGQIYGIDLASALSVAAAIAAYLSGYETYNPNLDERSGDDA